jgi:GNAT superfamily N-acetyltransferase
LSRASTTYRPLVPADIDACLEIFYAASEDLHARQGQPVLPRNPRRLRALFEHLVATDPERAWVAQSHDAPHGEMDGEPVGFGMAHRRGHHWFLAFLFVMPEWQGRGIGRELLERCLPSATERSRIAVCVESVQPVSTGLYATLGMTPRVPLYVMTGSLEADALSGAGSAVGGLEAVAFEALAGRGPAGHAQLADQVGALDRELLGYERPEEHRFWRALESKGFLYFRPGQSEPAAYGYVEGSGRIGPVAVREAALLPHVLGLLVRAVKPLGGWQLVVPGPAREAWLPLIRAGLRIDGAPAIYSASWDGPPFDRYLPLNFALL